MIVRRVRAEELWRCTEMASVAYGFALEGKPEDPQDVVRRCEEQPRGRTDLYWHMRWASFEDDDKTMMSTMAVVPFRMNFDGHNVRMDGVGGVASFPQYRRGGGVRGCFEKALPVMYEEGAAFSYLHPFSNAFYRKFGYEIAGMGRLWKVDLRTVARKKMPGSCTLLEKGVDLQKDMMQIARNWEKRYNCMVISEEIELAWTREANPFTDKIYTYVYHSADGTPKGYVTIRPEKSPAESVLNCRRFCFVDREGFEGLLMLLASMAADYSHAQFLTPEDIDLDGILPEWQKGSVQCERVTKGMARVINTEMVLRMAKMRGEGSIVLELCDEQIPQNNGRFAVSFAPGQETQVTRTEEKADMRLTIQDFTRLILGKHDIEDLPWLPDVQMYCEQEKAEKVFYRKPVFLCQAF